jgi:hypothetical protein
MATQMDRGELDLQEQLARIRQMGVNTDKAIAEMQKTRAEVDVMPRALGFQAMLATAALLGAGAAIAKLFFP